MTRIDLAGYDAAVLMFCTFYMRKMIPLRVAGIATNVTFMFFAFLSGNYPLLLLHSALLPVNITRMVQMMDRVSKVRKKARREFSMDSMVPFMTQEYFRKGEVVFSKGETADKLYYLYRGRIRLEELGTVVAGGEIIGEVGIFSHNRQRTATAVCEEDTWLLAMPESQVVHMYYQNPEFGLHLVKMIIERFIRNMDSAAKSA